MRLMTLPELYAEHRVRQDVQRQSRRQKMPNTVNMIGIIAVTIFIWWINRRHVLADRLVCKNISTPVSSGSTKYGSDGHIGNHHSRTRYSPPALFQHRIERTQIGICSRIGRQPPSD